MGVPKFYRWLSERYVSVNQIISDLSLLPEFDNLYLDMNGIIHACTHPNDQDISQTLTQEEMMKNIWNYVDRIVTQIVKPQKLLYVAVDGVAPRAKMNQQRARRFRSAQDAAEAHAEAEKKGVVIDKDAIFDSNCITPGTEFMCMVDTHLQYFIRKKMKEDPFWRRLTIIYSGHSIPGEGEHKIMQYIRDMKANPYYQPNIRHCMYGQDADLIMLALATHEPHFTLLREVIDFGKGRGGGGSNSVKTVIKQTKDASFQLLHVSILREYLEFEFLRDVPEEDRDVHLERVVDDFVFLTFLVGNDFLPHLPSLDISEHAFDRLFDIYGAHFQQWGGKGYLTNRGNIDYDRLQAFFKDIGAMEDDIFEAREEDVAQFNARRRKNAKRFGGSAPTEEELEAKEAEAQLAYEQAVRQAVQKGELPPEKVKDLGGNGNGNGGGEGEGEKGQQQQIQRRKKNFKGRYYYEKLGVIDPENSPKLQHLCQTYAEGVQWCLAYYVKGCVSWKWYYPYHYGPLMSDVKDLAGALKNLKFELGAPFKPFEQLLSCLPAASARFLPRRYQFLMTSPTSPILDFYPADFKVDMNGKHNPWEGVALIPFIDEQRLREAIKEYCPDTALTSDEKRRNSFGQILTFQHDPSVSATVPSCNAVLFPDLNQCQTTVKQAPFNIQSLTSFEPRLVPGTVIPSPGFPSLKVLPIAEVRIQAIKVNVHGTESRYRSICLSLPVGDVPPIETLAPEILGRPVYVNWPMMHEARITAVTDGETEFRLDPLWEQSASGKDAHGPAPSVTRTLSADEQYEWDEVIEAQQKSYLYGRGMVGIGGLEVGVIVMMLKVRPLQGLERDPFTGATRKVFGSHEAEVPIQMAMWSVPTSDPRFIEQGPVPLQERMPLGADVVLLDGQYKGQLGSVVGHGGGNSLVRVQTNVSDPDRPIGLLARKAFGRRYFEASEVIRALSLDGRVLGKITGSLFVDPGKNDLGLQLKIKGKYVLPDYVRRKTVNQVDGTAAWATSVDVVRIVGSADEQGGQDEPGGVPWEYSEKAVLLIRAYMETFSTLFEQLKRSPNEVAYDASRLFGPKYEEELERIRTWLAGQETANMPRVPLSTQVLSREAIRAIERGADELQVKKKKFGNRIQVRTVEMKPEDVLCANSHQASDIYRRGVGGRPELGDRVVNLLGLGVPFGLRGTVVSLHKHSACVEVLFDEEFIGGTSLQGTCSPYRGKLLPWSALLKLTAEMPNAPSSANLPQGPSLSALLQQGQSRGGKGGGGQQAAGGAGGGGGGGGGGGHGRGVAIQTKQLQQQQGNGVAPGAIQIMGKKGKGEGGGGSTPTQQQQQQQARSPSVSSPQAIGGGGSYAKGKGGDVGKSLLAHLKQGGAQVDAKQQKQQQQQQQQQQASPQSGSAPVNIMDLLTKASPPSPPAPIPAAAPSGNIMYMLTKAANVASSTSATAANATGGGKAKWAQKDTTTKAASSIAAHQKGSSASATGTSQSSTTPQQKGSASTGSSSQSNNIKTIPIQGPSISTSQHISVGGINSGGPITKKESSSMETNFSRYRKAKGPNESGTVGFKMQRTRPAVNALEAGREERKKEEEEKAAKQQEKESKESSGGGGAMAKLMSLLSFGGGSKSSSSAGKLERSASSSSSTSEKEKKKTETKKASPSPPTATPEVPPPPPAPVPVPVPVEQQQQQPPPSSSQAAVISIPVISSPAKEATPPSASPVASSSPQIVPASTSAPSIPTAVTSAPVNPSQPPSATATSSSATETNASSSLKNLLKMNGGGGGGSVPISSPPQSPAGGGEGGASPQQQQSPQSMSSMRPLPPPPFPHHQHGMMQPPSFYHPPNMMEPGGGGYHHPRMGGPPPPPYYYPPMHPPPPGQALPMGQPYGGGVSPPPYAGGGRPGRGGGSSAGRPMMMKGVMPAPQSRRASRSKEGGEGGGASGGSKMMMMPSQVLRSKSGGSSGSGVGASGGSGTNATAATVEGSSAADKTAGGEDN